MQEYRHTLRYNADHAGPDTLRLWYTLPVPGVEFPGPDAEDELNLDVVGTYTVPLDKFAITDTRSVHNDTDFAFLAIQKGANSGQLTQWKRVGDVNNGTRDQALRAVEYGDVSLGPPWNRRSSFLPPPPLSMPLGLSSCFTA